MQRSNRQLPRSIHAGSATYHTLSLRSDYLVESLPDWFKEPHGADPGMPEYQAAGLGIRTDHICGDHGS